MSVLYVLRDGEEHEHVVRIYGVFTTIEKAQEWSDHEWPDHTPWDPDPVERTLLAAKTGADDADSAASYYDPRFIEIVEVSMDPIHPAIAVEFLRDRDLITRAKAAADATTIDDSVTYDAAALDQLRGGGNADDRP